MNSKKKLHGRDRTDKGHVDLCFDENGRMATCGFDGDAKVFSGIDDENPIVIRVGGPAYCVDIANGRLYIAGDDNSVRSYDLGSSTLDGILLRFTAHVNHFCLNKKKNILVAGAGDFMVKALRLKTSSQTDFKGHTAPVLSVAIHPDDQIIASSSCDGSVRIWHHDTAKCTKTIHCLPKSNDVSISKTLARINFSPDGKFLVIPSVDKMIVYETKKWTSSFELTPNVSVLMPFSMTAFSPCGKFVAGASKDGWVFVWNFRNKKVVKREKHDKKAGLTGLAWDPSSDGVAYCDEAGNFTVSRDVVGSAAATGPGKAPEEKGKVLSGGDGQTAEDLFGDDFDDADFLASEDKVTAGSDGASFGKEDVVEDDDADDGGIPGVDVDGEDDDDDDVMTGKKKMTAVLEEDDPNDWSKKLEDLPVGGPAPAAPEPAPPMRETALLQRAFQPSSCPVGLKSRFMVWNDVGRVHQYEDGDDDEDDGNCERTIHVEFHDSATHHALHVDNSAHRFSMAALSTEALVLAREADGEVPSQVRCMHFNSWDSNKEWTIGLPEGEDVVALCAGDGWIAAATDRRLVRVFTVAGVQREVFAIPGPAVALAGRLDLLVVAYHEGAGIPGDQCLSYKLVSVLKKNALGFGRLALSAKSTLAWIGFSSEGSLFSVDSSGQVRMLNRGFAYTWIPVANLKEQCKGISDNYWVVSVRENPQQIRAIFCKGSKHPPTLPLPVVQILPFKIPLCELGTDKSNFEEQYWRTVLFSRHFDFWRTQGYEFEEADESRASSSAKEMLMRQFALACRSRREARAVEVCEMMPDLRTIQLAIKYATQKGDAGVAGRLNDLARSREAQEEAEVEEGGHPRAAPGVLEAPGPGRPRPTGRDFDHGDSTGHEDRCISLRPAKIISTSSNSSQGRLLRCRPAAGCAKNRTRDEGSGKSQRPPIFDESANDAPNDDDGCRDDNDDGDDECLVEGSNDEATNHASRSNSALTWRPGGQRATKTPSLTNSQTTKLLKNPFKVINGDSNSASERFAQMPRGTNIFDRMEKPSNSRGSFSNSFQLNSSSTSDSAQKKRKRKDQQDGQEDSQQDGSRSGGKKPKMANQKLTGFVFGKTSQ